MSYKLAEVPTVPESYRLTDDPCKGELVSVAVEQKMEMDGQGNFIGLRYKAVGIWIDASGIERLFPGTSQRVQAAWTYVSSGAASRDDAIHDLLDGADGKPEPLPSAMRNAIKASQAMQE